MKHINKIPSYGSYSFSGTYHRYRKGKGGDMKRSSSLIIIIKKKNRNVLGPKNQSYYFEGVYQLQ